MNNVLPPGDSQGGGPHMGNRWIRSILTIEDGSRPRIWQALASAWIFETARDSWLGFAIFLYWIIIVLFVYCYGNAYTRKLRNTMEPSQCVSTMYRYTIYSIAVQHSFPTGYCMGLSWILNVHVSRWCHTTQDLRTLTWSLPARLVMSASTITSFHTKNRLLYHHFIDGLWWNVDT